MSPTRIFARLAKISTGIVKVISVSGLRFWLRVIPISDISVIHPLTNQIIAKGAILEMFLLALGEILTFDKVRLNVWNIRLQ